MCGVDPDPQHWLNHLDMLGEYWSSGLLAGPDASLRTDFTWIIICFRSVEDLKMETFATIGDLISGRSDLGNHHHSYFAGAGTEIFWR